MKAVVQNAYGSSEVLELKEVAQPSVRKDDVLVRVRAAAVNAGDAFLMKGRPWPVRFVSGFPRPRDHILGWDAAGQVEAVGLRVTRFNPGDEVFGSCQHAFAEYVRAAENSLATKPANLPFEQAAAVPTAALTALQALRDRGRVRPGQKVLINGASGGVGSFAVQIAKAFGAEVTGVCSAANVELVRSIGADDVIDYTREDFTAGGPRYDIILDNVANRSLPELWRALAPRGILIPNSGHGGLGYVLKAAVLSTFMRKQGGLFIAKTDPDDLVFLKELIESGRIAPVVDRIYRLEEAPAAVEYVGRGHARGKVVITVGPSPSRAPSGRAG
jgi:NADPH:quinone reductase-like Zn-dependent oxidoreductase